MTCSSNTTCRPERGPRRGRLQLLIFAGALAAAAFAASPTIGQPDAAGQLMIEAQDLLAQGRAPEAEGRLHAALEAGVPRRAVAAQMGRALLAQGKTKEARGWLEAGEFSPHSALAGLRTLASLEMREGRLDRAGDAYNSALALAPNDAGLWADIARFRYVGGEHLLAVEAADHALTLGPDDPAVLLLQAELVRDREGMVPALRWFEKALERSPNDVGILLPYAATLGEAGQAVRMLAVTRQILELDPGNPRAFYLQAVMAARAGDYWLARRLLGRIAGRLDGLPGYRLVRGVAEIGAGNYALAVQVLDPLVAQQPGNRRARDLLARALFLDGEYRLVTDRFADGANREDASAYLRMTVARAFEQMGDRERAAPFLNSVAQAPSRAFRPVEGNRPVGELLAQGDLAQAGAVTGDWLARDPGNFDNLSLSGDVAAAQGDVRAALLNYASAARIRMPESLMARRFQAMFVAGQSADARRLALGYLAANPTSVEARRAVAALSAQAGDWERARRMLQSLVADGRDRDVRLLSDLALAQIGAGMADEAEATARRAYRLYPADPAAAQAWGFALALRGGKGETAAALLAKARKMAGDSPLLVQARTVLAEKRPG